MTVADASPQNTQRPDRSFQYAVCAALVFGIVAGSFMLSGLLTTFEAAGEWTSGSI
jgi:hypothetical protein